MTHCLIHNSQPSYKAGRAGGCCELTDNNVSKLQTFAETNYMNPSKLSWSLSFVTSFIDFNDCNLCSAWDWDTGSIQA